MLRINKIRAMILGRTALGPFSFMDSRGNQKTVDISIKDPKNEEFFQTFTAQEYITRMEYREQKNKFLVIYKKLERILANSTFEEMEMISQKFMGFVDSLDLRFINKEEIKL